ncbi:sensor histidine kinase [Nesterenkonia flava]|uniref:Histidine kinase n=1 Tax=Nesterenkonia flava TaxID=469799 RepID=A0ABU1FWP8_9MICC|nr:histidine kinase [Nesterenkonia flava]MDR5713033.1 histidine kinase [Nesterenkonia flava]
METTGQSGHARRRHLTEVYSGAAIAVLCLGIGVLLLLLGPGPHIPAWMWSGLFLGSLAAVVWSLSGQLGAQGARMVYGAAVGLGWSVVLTMPEQGMLVVLLVALAAVGTYLLPIWVVGVVILLNCTVAAIQQLMQGADAVSLAVTVVFYLIIHSASVLSTYALYRESALRAELEEKNVELEAAGVLLETSAKTAERLRISRELHDAVGHQLTVLNLELEAARHRTRGGHAEVHIERAAAVAKELLGEVRTTVGELREAEPADVRANVERLAAAVPSLSIQVEVDPAVAVDEEQAGALVRAAQEIITNTVKHSEAQNLSLTVSLSDRATGAAVILRAVNDGVAPKRVVFGHGLNGLRERLELLGGELVVTPWPEFTVEVLLPTAGRPVLQGERYRDV